jgi:hypothetical protein
MQPFTSTFEPFVKQCMKKSRVYYFPYSNECISYKIRKNVKIHAITNDLVSLIYPQAPWVLKKHQPRVAFISHVWLTTTDQSKKCTLLSFFANSCLLLGDTELCESVFSRGITISWGLDWSFANWSLLIRHGKTPMRQAMKHEIWHSRHCLWWYPI